MMTNIPGQAGTTCFLFLCPFCGGKAEMVFYRISEMGEGCGAICTVCKASGPKFEDVNAPETEAAAAWNHRNLGGRIDAVPDLLGALRLALKYWADRQQRYKNRHPVWVEAAKKAISKVEGK